MAEFCRECFIDQLMTSKEQDKVASGEITFILSKFNDLCEGCGEIIPIVLQIVENNLLTN